MRDDGVLEVLEVRRYLEPAATALAASRIDDEQLVAEDASFHASVAEASGNGTLASLLAGLHVVTTETCCRAGRSGAPAR